MKRFILVAVSVVASLTFAQSVVRTFQFANVTVDAVTLVPLPDGGCFASWQGKATSDDGVVLTVGSGRELGAAANQNRCAVLVSAGVSALAKQSGIIADAGAL